MNRIRELRELAGLTSNDLAAKIGTTGPTIRRLETGERQLTEYWMRRIAEALDVTPHELLSIAAVIGLRDDVIEVQPDTSFAKALALRDMVVYRVIGDSVCGSGVEVGETVTVDRSERAIAEVRPGDVVLVKMKAASGEGGPDYFLTLRVWLVGGLITTNRDRGNASVRLSDPALDAKVIGVVVR